MWFSVLPICYYLPYLKELFVHLGGPRHDSSAGKLSPPRAQGYLGCDLIVALYSQIQKKGQTNKRDDKMELQLAWNWKAAFA